MEPAAVRLLSFLQAIGVLDFAMAHQVASATPCPSSLADLIEFLVVATHGSNHVRDVFRDLVQFLSTQGPVIEPRDIEHWRARCGWIPDTAPPPILVAPAGCCPFDGGRRPRPGSTWGPFRVGQLLGSGAFGEVYLARINQSDQQVALKVMTEDAAEDPCDRRRFKREVRTAKTFFHPHIVRAYDDGEVDGVPYLTMDYVGGGTLRGILAKGPIPVAAALRIAAQICTALVYMHTHQDNPSIHRDIKPNNILMAEGPPPNSLAIDQACQVDHDFPNPPRLRLASGETDRYWPLLSDFGLVRVVHPEYVRSNVSSTGMIGTINYMSPEAAAGVFVNRKFTPKTDVYSLGATLYEMVTGRTGFRQHDPELLKRQIRREEPVPPRRWNPELPESVETIILTAMRHRPEDRYRDAQEMLEDILRVNSGQGPGRPRPENRRLQTAVLGQDRTQMALIPAGEYQIGSAMGDANERPQHPEHSNAFWIDIHPVTNRVYDRFLHAVQDDSHLHQWCHPEEPPHKDHHPSNWDRVENHDLDRPVVGVDWWDAWAYSRWAGKRLPTEVEWEIACRAETTTEYSFGDDFANLHKYACFNQTLDHGTCLVAQHLPNPWGIYDMHGNVDEWCEDWFEDRGWDVARGGGGPADRCCHRGGCFNSAAANLRSSRRRGSDPKTRRGGLGFRCVMDANGVSEDGSSRQY